MAVERSGFEIELKADASGVVKGSETAAKGLQGVASATKDLDASLQGAKGTLDASGKALEDNEEHGKKGEEGFKIFGRGAHEAHAGLRVLNDAIPGFEQMARFLTNSLTLTMGIGGMAISFLKGKIDEMNKALDELNSSPGARGEWAEKLKEKAEQSDVSLTVWEDHIKRVATAEQSLQALADRSLAVDREKLTSENAIAQANKELAEARLALAVKLGQVTPEQAIKIKLDIDEAAFKQQLEIKAKEIEAEIKARQNEYDNAVDQTADRMGQVGSNKSAADAAAAAKLKNDEKLAQDKKNLDASVEAQRKAQEIVDSLEGGGMWGGAWDKSDPQYYTLQAARDKVESEGRIQGGIKRSIGQEESKRLGLDTAAETSKADYEAAKSKLEESVKLQKDLETKMAALREDLTAEKAKVTALEAIHAQTSATKAQEQESTEADTAVKRANAAAAHFNSGVATGPGEVHQALAQVTGILEAHAAMSDVQHAALEEVKGRLSRLEMQGQLNRHF
jgi:hypothetical protein